MIERRALWGIRVYYFLWIGAAGLLLPFINLFYVRQGLTGAEVGWLGTVSAATALMIAPLWGRWSDSVSRPGRLLQFALLCSAGCYLALSQQQVFIGMATVIGAHSLLSAGIEPLSDTLTLGLGDANSKASFGSVRAWGSLGWALMALASGWLIEHTSLFTAFAGYAAGLLLCVAVLNATPIGMGPLPQAKAVARQKPSATIAQSILGDSPLLA